MHDADGGDMMTSLKQERLYMLNSTQEKKLIGMIPEDSTGEDRRAAYAVITGLRDDKSDRQIAAYYSVDANLVNKWMKFFDVKSSSSTKGKTRSRKSGVLMTFVRENSGRTVTPAQVAEELSISLPTFYNFYNANRHFFKKVKRGEFEIINPSEARTSEK